GGRGGVSGWGTGAGPHAGLPGSRRSGAAPRPLSPEGDGRDGADGGRAQVGRVRGDRGGLRLLRDGGIVRLRARALRDLDLARQPSTRARGEGRARGDRGRRARDVVPAADRAPGGAPRTASGRSPLVGAGALIRA